MERCRALNLNTIELSHPQFMLPQADLNTFAATRRKLKTGGVDLRSWFCGDLTKTSEIERLVEGVRLFGVKTVSGSATRELLDSINAACGSAGFRFGIHNHYFANRKFLYESPDDVLAALNGHPNLFSTFDSGHMIACGFDPTKAYEKLKSYIRIIHLKDEDRPGHDVVMGKGSGNMAKFLRTISNDGFNGLAAIEFEEGTDPKVEVSECMSFIRGQISLKIFDA
jgi:sugar phosphate isomerase/epimerase